MRIPDAIIWKVLGALTGKSWLQQKKFRLAPRGLGLRARVFVLLFLPKVLFLYFREMDVVYSVFLIFLWHLSLSSFNATRHSLRIHSRIWQHWAIVILSVAVLVTSTRFLLLFFVVKNI